MEYRELGDTGVRVPEIGLGTWQYKVGVEPLRRGVELGAFLIDTAEGYGTEDIVGKAVQGMRDRVFIATKVSPSNFGYEDVLKAADGSLRRLKVDYIDLYQLHWPNSDIPIGETMSAMEELADAGKVRFIGVSNFSVAQLREAQATVPRYKIVSNQVRYSLVDRSIERDLLTYCQQNRVTIIAYSPLAVGLRNITSKDRNGALNKVATMLEKTEAQVALNWCISRENVIAIPKSNSIERTEENCNASGWRLSSEHIRLLEDVFS